MKARQLMLCVTLLISATTLSAAELRDVREYGEMCDASAMIPVGDDFFLAANDEDNTLRLFPRDAGGAPVATFQLDQFLGVVKQSPEVDLEGAARVGDLVFWIGSHGNNKDGKPRPNRHRFFATRLEGGGAETQVTPWGKPYERLLEAFAADARLSDLRWSELSALAPEQRGAVNIEGLAATSTGSLWIAFRNPVPRGKALVVELENPAELIQAKSPALGRIARLDLEGSGIRSLEFWPAEQAYLIVSGPFNDDGAFQLWRWSGDPDEAPRKLSVGTLDACTPEAVGFFTDRPRELWVLSDDGSRDVDGENCKEAPKRKRHFRAAWLQLGE